MQCLPHNDFHELAVLEYWIGIKFPLLAGSISQEVEFRCQEGWQYGGPVRPGMYSDLFRHFSDTSLRPQLLLLVPALLVTPHYNYGSHLQDRVPSLAHVHPEARGSISLNHLVLWSYKVTPNETIGDNVFQKHIFSYFQFSTWVNVAGKNLDCIVISVDESSK